MRSHPSPSPTADLTLGYLVILTSLFGVPANLASLLFFLRHRRQTLAHRTASEVVRDHTLLFNTLYIAIVLNDLCISLTGFPVAEGFLRSRDGALFNNHVFCTAWGVLWNVLPFYSVFLVLTMSIIRTVILIKPKIYISRRRLLALLTTYLALLLLRGGAAALASPSISYTYTQSDNYCWEHRDRVPWYEKMQLVIAGTLLALPILPTIVSCGVSVFIIMRHTPVKAGTDKNRNVHKNASITVVLVTLVYIALNFPSFLNYVYYVNLRVQDVAMLERYSSTLLWCYSWNLTYVCCVLLNSCVNPVVYFARNKHYRKEAKRTGKMIRDSIGGIVTASKTSYSMRSNSDASDKSPTTETHI